MNKAARATKRTVTHWSGGGGFREVEVASSMFEELDGTIVLSDWAVDGDLAEAVCAQVGYGYEPATPFAGRRGRSRLAVLDGMLTTGVTDFLMTHLAENETLLVLAQTLEPGIDEYLRRHRSGSRAKKIPRDLALVGVRSSRLVRLAPKSSVVKVVEEQVEETVSV
jgi:adenine-specific DNA-methyltransferase